MVAALTMLTGSVVGPVKAQSDTATPLPETESVAETSMSFEEALAAELGISVEELDTAIEDAGLVSGVGGFGNGGRVGPGAAGGDHGQGAPGVGKGIRGGFPGVSATELAVFLGVTEEQIDADRDSGLKIIEIAVAHGKSEAELRTFLIEQATARIDERLAEINAPLETEDQATPVASI